MRFGEISIAKLDAILTNGEKEIGFIKKCGLDIIRPLFILVSLFFMVLDCSM